MVQASANWRTRGCEWWDSMRFCLLDLARLTGGTLQLAAMPPLDGELTAVRRIVLSPDSAGKGDVFWCFGSRSCDAELAYLRGALAVVMAEPAIEPWPGRACMQIGNPAAALGDLIATLANGREEFLHPAPELKDLQLSAGRRSCISSSAHSKCRMSNAK